MRYIITSAPPNPNGDLHLGHLAGPFLGGDVQGRYLRARGHDVSYVSYADDFSCYVQRRASELSATAERTAHVFGRRIENTLALAGMRHQYFTHPLREPLHADVVQAAFTVLWENGQLCERELPVHWCAHCSRYLYEAEMRGRCHHCAAPADGFYCEECGRPQDAAALVDARCTACGQSPELRRLSRFVFPLEQYRASLRDYYATQPMRPRLRAYLDAMLSRPLPETTISRQADYGIPVPLAGWEGHILDTWFSGLWGYVAATQALGRAVNDEQLASAWTASETRIIEFLGFDCSFSHALLWPALGMAHGDLTLPSAIVTNEFYQLEGAKFSTSRGHALWGSDVLQRVPADALRFFLCLSGPETEQTSFAMSEFAAVVERVLCQGLDRWCGAVLDAAVARGANGTPGLTTGSARAVVDDLALKVAAALEPEGFSPRAAAAAIRDALADLNALLGSTAGDGGVAPSDHVEALARFAAVVAPLLPVWSGQVLSALNVAPADSLGELWPWPGERPLVTNLPPVIARPLRFDAVAA